ncbi:unnamed protein product [Nezara viridula]|uniref:Uncharacterized protein n=1 Tax=Nezara viridula TaxID=85310 RepID=A0A9P0HIG7_NEZVI|nr:unnamed protein product [Nezara viridula]
MGKCHKLRITVRGMERYIGLLGITRMDRKTNKWIGAKTDLPDIVEKVQIRKHMDQAVGLVSKRSREEERTSADGLGQGDEEDLRGSSLEEYSLPLERKE